MLVPLVIYSAKAPQRPAKRDERDELWTLFRYAREQPFESVNACAWRDAISSFSVRIDESFRREFAGYSATDLCGELRSGISHLREPSVEDVVRVSEQLVQLQSNVARMRKQYPYGKDEL